MNNNMFKFNFDFLPSSSSPDKCGNINATSIKISRGVENGSSKKTLGNVDNNKPILTTTKPLEILNISESLSRLNGYPEDQNYDEVHLSKENFRIDPLRRVKFSGCQRTIPDSTETPKHMAVSEHNATESIADIAVRSHIIHEKEMIEKQKTDIIPGIYEGGLKVWESSVDLCIHLAQELSRLREEERLGAEVNTNDFKESNRLDNDVRHAILNQDGSTWELGCGHGLPGCLIARELFKRRQGQGQERHNSTDNEGESTHSGERKESSIKVGREIGPIVLFSDYNNFVIRDVTLPNIVLNTWCASNCQQTPTSEISNKNNDEAVELLKRLTCLASGDWLKLSELLSASKDLTTHTKVNEMAKISKFPIDGRFDLILGSEVTYSISSTKDTVILLLRHLKLNTGIGLVATKRYYFGVGGGTDLLREIAMKEAICVDGITYGLSIEKIKSYDCGKGNIRDLLRIRCVKR